MSSDYHQYTTLAATVTQTDRLRSKWSGIPSQRHTGNACKISDLERRSAHAQMAWSQKIGKSEISLDTGVTLSDSDSAPVKKFLNPDSGNFSNLKIRHQLRLRLQP